MKYFKKRLKVFFRNMRYNETNHLIVCLNCGLVQKKAYDWDYQKCNCGSYLYDYR